MIPLVVRSHYSLMWGTTPVERLCRAAAERGFTHLALTDTDNLYGLWPFLRACRRHGLTPIVGAEVTDPGQPLRAVCLVENQDGYRNLCRLLTRRREPGFSLQHVLPAYAVGLTVLTSCSSLLEAWRADGLNVTAAIARRPDSPTTGIRRSAKRLGAPVAAVPGAFFLDPEDYEVHRLLRAISLNTSLSRLKILDAAPPDAFLATRDEYKQRFSLMPEAIETTYVLAERLTFTSPDNTTVMPPWEDTRGRSAHQVLMDEAYQGAVRIYGNDLPEAVVERLEHELALIREKNFSSYFLVVRDIVRRSPRICGRGSGAASLVAYCLGITNVCPIKHNLYFERFINRSRKDPPDIDVDFAWDERDAVLESVLHRYEGRSAMVSSHILIQPRMAIREVAKVFGLTETEIDQVTRRLPWFWRGREEETDLRNWLGTLPETRELDFAEPWPEILRLAQRIVGTPRHLSVHPGGVVITPGPITDYVPVEPAPKGVPIIQWEKDGAEDGGLVKIDLLGNRSLGVIRDAISNIRKNGHQFDESSWEPEDDRETQDWIASGRTMGCFYIESPAMRLLQRKAGVGDFDHLVIHSSIIRPAANDCIQEYLKRLKGEPWEPLHPFLEDILDETFGIMVYQEDVSRTAVALAGFSHEDADRLRKIMTKKDREFFLRDYMEQFWDGARAKGVPDCCIEAVWNMMLSFNGYSFCKPHSASYARVSFQAAYLKCYYPAEFMAAVISNRGGFYSEFAYVSEARRLGVNILPPDVNLSEINWQGRDRAMRVGLQSIRGLNHETMRRIVAERRIQPYRSFDDFCRRVNPAEDEARALIHSGACDGLGGGHKRTALLWVLARIRQSRERNAAVLFSDPLDLTPPELPPPDERDELRRQYNVLGFLPDRHPIVLFNEVLAKRKLIKAAELEKHMGRRVSLAGWLITGKTVRSKHDDPMQFLTFEDETGIIETTFFPTAYRRFCSLLDWGRPYIISGLVDENFGVATLSVDHIWIVPAQMSCDR